MLSGPLEVRAVAKTDFDQWLPLWEGYNAFYKRVGPKAVPIDVTLTTWGRFFDHYEPVNCLVADVSGQLFGTVHYIFHRNTTMIEPTCYLQDLFTSETVRGQGIGRALVSGVYARAIEAGCSRVYWQTHETNLKAQNLYDNIAERSGFIVYRKDL
jgi:GNAT superfamily N-acetyltransferase